MCKKNIARHAAFGEKLKIPVSSKVLVMSKGIQYQATICKIQQTVEGNTEFKIRYDKRKTVCKNLFPISEISTLPPYSERSQIVSMVSHFEYILTSPSNK